MKKLIPILLLSLVMPLCITGCSKDNDSDDSGFDGSIEDIRDFYNDELVDALIDLGFDINTGNNPPNIEGSYLFSPVTLQASSVQGDDVGDTFYDYTLTFSNQNNDDLTVDYHGDQTIQVDVGDGSFIAGENNNFSVFLISSSSYDGVPEEADTAIALSGTFTETGIENLQMAFLMMDNKGYNSVLIPNNKGRIVYDPDLLSPKQ
jgi:hypothetical protein